MDATNDELASFVADNLKKEYENVFFDEMDQVAPTDLTEFISTGSSLLDIAISNRQNGGIAIGRITEISGLEGSGKSLLCAHMIANVQKEGGLAVLIDTEFAINEEFFIAVGVDMNKLIVSHPTSIEDVFEMVEKIIESIRKKQGNSRKVLIIVDSIAGVGTKVGNEGSFEQKGFGTQKAKCISAALQRITPNIAFQKIALVLTNQLRQRMNAMPFQDPYITPGGMGIQYFTSTRLRLSIAGAIKTKEKEQIGVKISAKVTKNRLGPPNRKVTFDVYYDRGVDDVSSWIAYLKEKEIIEGTNGRFTFTDSNGEEHKFQTSTWKEFCEEHPTVFDEIYIKMADAMIMQYNSEGLSTVDGTADVDTGEEE